MRPVISLIIPVYNSAGHLRRCLAAIRASDYTSYECLVVDDGSTDESPAVAAQFGVRVLTLAAGPYGPAYARNEAANSAQGAILFFVDADVVIHRDTLGKVAGVFENDPALAAVFGSYDAEPAESNFFSQYKNLFHHFVHQHANPEATTFWTGCGAVRRSVFLALGGFDAQHYRRPSIEDIELGYRLRQAGYRIALHHDIQAKHLKRWTLWGMIKSDVLDRAIPWTRLSLRTHIWPNDLNLRRSQRLSALLPCLLLFYLGLSPFLPLTWPWVVAPLVGIPPLVLALNYPLYAFFARQRGVLFAVAALPFHLLYYLYSVLALMTAVVLHVVEGVVEGASRQHA